MFLQSPTTSIEYKALIIRTLGYFILPIDLISDFLPIVGFTDDTSALIATIKVVKKYYT